MEGEREGGVVHKRFRLFCLAGGSEGVSAITEVGG
jgi:hypothetical protein